MGAIPILTTERLTLRPFRDDDAPAVQRMLITPHVAETTLNVPHPYPPGAALEWIRRERKRAAEGLLLHWAITRPPDQVIDAIGVTRSAYRSRVTLHPRQLMRDAVPPQ